MRTERLETAIKRDIQAALGAEPDLLLLVNAVGQARMVSEDTGKVYFVPYGLGKGSPDLVGILRRGDVGTWFCLEVKVPGEVPRPEQEKSHAVWRRFGAFIAAVTSVEEARAALARARGT